MGPTIVTSWDQMPPEVHANGETFSTRVLALQYARMRDRLYIDAILEAQKNGASSVEVAKDFAESKISAILRGDT